MKLRKKKISIKYFLNKKLKSQEGDYPLYIRVNYSGTNTKFKFIFNGVEIFLKEDEFENEVYKGDYYTDYNYYEKMIEDVVRNEEKINKGEYNLSGLSEKILFYQTNLREIIESDVIKSIKSEIKARFEDTVNLDSLGDELRFFYLSCKAYYPIQTLLSETTKIKISTFIAYSQFLGGLREIRYANVYEWSLLDHKKRFEQFLIIFLSGDSERIFSNPFLIVEGIHNDFPVKKIDVINYINYINSAAYG